MSTHGPIDPKLQKLMKEVGGLICRAVDQTVHRRGGPRYGFALLMFELNSTEGRMNYISNAQRRDMITALKELLARFEGFDVKAPETRQ